MQSIMDCFVYSDHYDSSCSKNQSESKKESGKAAGKYQPQLFAAVAAGDKEKVSRS